MLSTGGKGTTSGTQVATAFSADGTTTVAWGKPGNRYEEGGALEVFTRAPGAAAFGPAQPLADAATGIVMAGGPGSSAALAWMTGEQRRDHVHWTVHASTRPQAGGAFGADQAISDPATAALWPTIAITPEGRRARRLDHQPRRQRQRQPDRRHRGRRLKGSSGSTAHQRRAGPAGMRRNSRTRPKAGYSRACAWGPARAS